MRRIYNTLPYIPEISVIMSVYNELLDWIRQSIDSILNQTFCDFEFIIVNDNPDGISDFIREFHFNSMA